MLSALSLQGCIIIYDLLASYDLFFPILWQGYLRRTDVSDQHEERFPKHPQRQQQVTVVFQLSSRFPSPIRELSLSQTRRSTDVGLAGAPGHSVHTSPCIDGNSFKSAPPATLGATPGSGVL